MLFFSRFPAAAVFLSALLSKKTHGAHYGVLSQGRSRCAFQSVGSWNMVWKKTKIYNMYKKKPNKSQTL